mgnify:CR=1 FL=1
MVAKIPAPKALRGDAEWPAPKALRAVVKGPAPKLKGGYKDWKTAPLFGKND